MKDFQPASALVEGQFEFPQRGWEAAMTVRDPRRAQAGNSIVEPPRTRADKP